MTVFSLLDRSTAHLVSGLAMVYLATGAIGPMSAQPTTYQPPASSSTAVTGIPFEKALPVDKGYRSEFISCGRMNRFRGQVMPPFRECSRDANNVRALLRFPDGTVFFDSKLSLDMVGSWLACKGSGAPTSPMSNVLQLANQGEPPRSGARTLCGSRQRTLHRDPHNRSSRDERT